MSVRSVMPPWAMIFLLVPAMLVPGTSPLDCAAQAQGSPGGDRSLLFSCQASPSSVFAGTPVTVTGSSSGPKTRNPGTYTWESSGGKIAPGDSAYDTVVVTTAGLAPGDYLVAGHLSRGNRAKQNAFCTARFTVLAPSPPTISCSANPVSVLAGTLAVITAKARSTDGRPLSFDYSASAGRISGNRAAVTLDTRGASPGQIQVDCRVSDDLGQTAKATTVVNVSAPPAPVAERRELCSLSFARDTRRPVRVDNEAKACLDDVALTLKRETAARLEIIGERAAGESAAQALARASNARIYLAREKGIDPARIGVKMGNSPGRAAEIELVPLGTPLRYAIAPFEAVASAAPSSAPGSGTSARAASGTRPDAKPTPTPNRTDVPLFTVNRSPANSAARAESDARSANSGVEPPSEAVPQTSQTARNGMPRASVNTAASETEQSHQLSRVDDGPLPLPFSRRPDSLVLPPLPADWKPPVEDADGSPALAGHAAAHRGRKPPPTREAPGKQPCTCVASAP